MSAVPRVGVVSFYEGCIEEGLICPITLNTLKKPVFKVSCCRNLYSDSLKEWAVESKNKICPTCFAILDVSKILSPKEKLIQKVSTFQTALIYRGSSLFGSLLAKIWTVLGKVIDAHAASYDSNLFRLIGNL